MNEFFTSFLITLIVFPLCIICVKCCCCSKSKSNRPAYSAPVVVTSRSHQVPGTSPVIIVNSSSSPLSSSPANGTSMTYPATNFVASGSHPHSSNSPIQMPMPYSGQGITTPGSQVNSNAPYPATNTQSPYPPQPSFPPHTLNMPYPPQTMYPPQDGSNITQRSNVLQPSAPYPTSPALDMDLPPNYDEAMTNCSSEPKKL